MAPDVLSTLAIVSHSVGTAQVSTCIGDGGRRVVAIPKVPLDVRQLIRGISIANPLWGAPRIHGELLKGQTTVAKYMARGDDLRARDGSTSCTCCFVNPFTSVVTGI